MTRALTDAQLVRLLLRQSERRDLLPRTKLLLQAAALSLGVEALADRVKPLSRRAWCSLAALLGLPMAEMARRALERGKGPR